VVLEAVSGEVVVGMARFEGILGFLLDADGRAMAWAVRRRI